MDDPEHEPLEADGPPGRQHPAEMTAMPWAPARITSGALAGPMPPIAMTGIETARTASRRSSSPLAGPASAFEPVG